MGNYQEPIIGLSSGLMVHGLIKRKVILAERRDGGKEQYFGRIPENTDCVVLLPADIRFFLYMPYPKYGKFSRKTRYDILSRAYRRFHSKLDISYTASGHMCTIFET